MRSTMLPGSMRGVVVPTLEEASGKQAGEGFGIALYPEFLREGTAIRDYREAEVVVIGRIDEQACAMLGEVVEPLSGTKHIVDCAVAEMVKYSNNAWHATKIVFSNEIGALCKSLGIDSHQVMQIVCADRKLNISSAYMRPGFAFGGSCLPKDLRALAYKAKTEDVAVPLVDALLLSNEQHVRRAFRLVEAAGNRRVGLLGLTFKGGTDDLRESPAVELAERLVGKGYDLRIYDANVRFENLMGTNLSFIQGRMPHLARLLDDRLDAVIAHADTVVLAHGQLGEPGRLQAARQGQIVVDLGRLPDAMRPRHARYEGICW
jgi:GDP-mannose 6-dehydrogenase